MNLEQIRKSALDGPRSGLPATVAESALKVLLPRWRASLSPSVPLTVIEGFLRRRRATLLAVVTHALRAAEGRMPTTADEFAAYDGLVARERPRDAQPDDVVLRRVLRRVDAVLAEGYPESITLRNHGQEYVDARAEALFLREAGWDAVPLLSLLPTLAIAVGGGVVAVRDAMGTIAIHPARTGTLNHLIAAVFKAETTVIELADELAVGADTRERLAQYAGHLWDRTRAESRRAL